MGQKWTVVIDEGGRARTNIRVISKKGSGDSIQWIVLDDATRLIDFINGSPMVGGESPVAVQGNRTLTIDPNQYPPNTGYRKKFKYNIEDTDGTVLDDPDIVLED
jgi:hypothetical protein